MLVDLTSGDDRPIYVQIVDEIRRAIVLGTLRPDEPLPSVRDLAGDLRVNPNTVSQAYRELERAGAVYVRRGQGTFVANGGRPALERERMLRELTERARREAYRHGFTASELADALRREPEVGGSR